MPLNTAGAQDAAGDDPLSMAIQAEQRSNPTTVSVDSPTKFGKLINLVQPMLEGAAVGGFSGKGHPGGGFGAAQDFYTAQRNRQLQQAMLQHTLNNDQFKNALEAARTQHEINRPNFPRTTFTNANGPNGPVLMHTNPDTGQPEEVPGYSPFEKDPADLYTPIEGTNKVLNRRSGAVSDATVAGASPATTGAPASSPFGTKVASAKDSGSPRVPAKQGVASGAPASSAPIFPKKGSEKPYSADLQDFDYLTKPVEEGGMGLTPDQAHARMKSQDRKPDNSDQPLSGTKYNAARQKIQGNLDRDLKGSETTRAKDIKAAVDDPDQVRQAEEDNADRKQQIHQKYHDEAEAMGIDLGQVPDYRSQLDAAPQNSAPQGTKGAAASTAKVANTSDILAYAQKNNISSIEARKKFLAKGYTIKPVTGPK